MQTSPSFKPLENIALAISGGGFRAAAFGLGCLSYLHKIGYLRHVTFVSSASGGTLPAMLYSQYNYQGKTFEECYQHLVTCMNGEVLLKKVFEILKENAYWKDRPEKKRNLINAFAIAYDEVVFEKEEFGLYWQKIQNPHIEEVCFNAAELVNGRTFRFQKGLAPKRKVGNKDIHFDNKLNDNHAQKLKLADIMAASSCFPGGFEPIVFPQDFTHDIVTSEFLFEHFKQEPAYEGQLLPKNQPFGLMDGGIDDNQGVGSLLLANEYRRKNNKKMFDTIIICDVDSSFTEPYVPPLTTNKAKGLWKLTIESLVKKVKSIGIGVLVWFISAIVFSIAGIIEGTIYIKIIGGLVLGGLLFAAAQLWKLKNSIDAWKTNNASKTEGTWLRIAKRYGGFFLKLPFLKLVPMLKARASSAGMLIGDLFLNQVRRLHFNALYENADYHNIPKEDIAVATFSDSFDDRFPYANRCVTTLIHDLSKANAKNLEDRLKKRLDKPIAELLKPRQKLQDLAEKTRKMDTTLWFDEQHKENKMLENLIACGQATMCFNLLKYLHELKTDAQLYAIPVIYPSELEALRIMIEEDWQIFNENPLSLLPKPNL